MSNERKLTVDDARQSLESHVADKGLAIQQKYGPHIGWSELLELLEDRDFVRYPCDIKFDASQLEPGEFAHPVAQGKTPEDGFIMYVHPNFAAQLDRVPALVLYQLVCVNYGAFASANDAETFGSCALGIGKEDYYALLCNIADELEPGA